VQSYFPTIAEILDAPFHAAFLREIGGLAVTMPMMDAAQRSFDRINGMNRIIEGNRVASPNIDWRCLINICVFILSILSILLIRLILSKSAFSSEKRRLRQTAISGD
jgi:hypothetical protein